MKRVRANPGQGARLREEILLAADALLAEAGSEEALTLRAVAARAGVSTPSVYLHFADRDALVVAVCLRSWDELERRMREAAERARDPFTGLGARGRAYIQFAVAHPAQYRVLMMRDSEGAAASCFAYILEGVQDCVRSGVLRGDPNNLALVLWTAAHGCASLLISQPSFPWPDDLDAFIQDTVRMAGWGTAVASRLPKGGYVADIVPALDAFAERVRLE